MIGVKRLFDLVKVPDQTLKTAWYYALSNTLVANDLQQASRIAYGSDKRFSRVVTLKVSQHFLSGISKIRTYDCLITPHTLLEHSLGLLGPKH